MARPRKSKYQFGVTEEEREEFRRLHGQGHGRNEISRLTGRCLRTVSLHCADMGLTFDRTMTEAATAARMADLAERRSILAEALQGDAEKLTAQQWLPYTVFNFGGSDNSYRSKLLDEPPADAKKNLMAAAGIAIDKSLRLCPPETDTEGLAAVDAWLRGMMPDQ